MLLGLKKLKKTLSCKIVKTLKKLDFPGVGYGKDDFTVRGNNSVLAEKNNFRNDLKGYKKTILK